MMRFLLSALLCLTISVSAHAQTIDDPETWYRDGYAPLWNDEPQQKLDQMLEYYAPKLRTHRADGTPEYLYAQKMLGESLTGWTAEGWLRSELTGLITDRINASTVAFKARWADHNQDAPQEESCGWYLADWIDDRWQFTAYADLDCAVHDF